LQASKNKVYRKLKLNIMKKLVFSFLIFFVSLSISYSQSVASFTNDTVCYGDTTTITSTSTSTFTILKTYWDIDSNGVFDDDSGLVVKRKFATYKTYNVGIQVISTNDTDIIYQRIITNPTPTAEFDIDFPTQCVTANNFTFTNKSTIPSPGTMTYFWDLDNGSTSTTAVDTTAFYFVANTYNITMAAISDKGCTDTIVKPIYVINVNVADFTIDDSIQCAGTDSFVLSNSSLVCSGSLVSFSWDFNNDSIFGDSVGQGTVSSVFGAPGDYYVGLRIITSTGRDSVFKKLTVNPSPTAAFATTSAVNQCQSGNSYDFANSSTTPSGTLTYLWNFGNGDTSTSSNINAYNFFNYGKYNVTLYATAGGCTDSIVNSVEVYPSPYVDFTINDSTQCLADTFFVTNNSFIFGVGLTHNWYFGDGSPALVALDTHYQYLTADTFAIKLVSVSDSGCADSIMKNVYVFTKSTADFVIDDSIRCDNEDSFVFTNSSINCGMLVSVNWDLDNDGLFDDSTGNNIKYKFAVPGTYPIGMQIITNSDTDFVYKNIHQNPMPVADFTINTDPQPLTTNNYVFTNATTITPVEPITYLWDFDNGMTATAPGYRLCVHCNRYIFNKAYCHIK
jgi:PKD repeat protein